MGASMPRPNGTEDTRISSRREPPPPARGASLRQWAEYQLRVQAVACELLGSQLYAHLLDAAADDVAAGGPAWSVLQPHAGREIDSALALRFMAALHRLVLTRQAPQLALTYPSVGGNGDPVQAWSALHQLLATEPEKVSALVAAPCQTNDVGRCAALLAGFLLAAQRSSLPLHLLEIGASGGLNLRWNHYRYEHNSDDRAWGPPDSPVRLRGSWDVPRDLLGTHVEIAGRAGCDPRPVDPTTQDGRTALTASVWADQPERFERLRGALQVAAAAPATVAQQPAGEWLPEQLCAPRPNVATVVYHSVVLQYIAPEERATVLDAIAAAGARATRDAPLFWVSMEPDNPLREMSVRFTAWPGGQQQLLATAGAHGLPLHWAT